MKHVITLILRGAYSSGGNTGVYGYKITDAKEVVSLTSALWKPRNIVNTTPKAVLTITAFELTSPVGAPPAFGTRTVTIGTDGKVTFLASEAWESMELEVELADVEDHDYGNALWTTPIAVGEFARIDLYLNAVLLQQWTTPIEDPVYSGLALKTTGDILKVVWIPSTATKTAAILNACVAVIGDEVLLTRPYDGAYIEGAIKTVFIGLQAMNRRYEGAIAQLVNYFRTGSNPITMAVPTVYVGIPMGS